MPPRRTSPPPLADDLNGNGSPGTAAQFVVELPAGGHFKLNNAEEVEQWERTCARYIDDYSLVKTNDLVLLGAIVSQVLAMYRAQNELSDPKKAGAAVSLIGKCSEQIRELEKALGIDKKTREAGGQHTVQDYLTRVKRAAHAKGVRISERTKAYEAFTMELRWKLRVLRNGDAEDRRHHGLTEKTVINWAEQELAALEEKDKDWAREKGAVFVGTL